jgi:hypothetical protein
MELSWMLLANHAESPPNGLLYVSGAGWDTVNVQAPLPPGAAPEGVVAIAQGHLVVRLSFHHTETGTDFPLEITVIDEDGAEIARIQGTVTAERQDEDAPPRWSRATNVVLPLTGMPLPRFGEYRIHLRVNGEHKGDLPFRVVRRY